MSWHFQHFFFVDPSKSNFWKGWKMRLTKLRLARLRLRVGFGTRFCR